MATMSLRSARSEALATARNNASSVNVGGESPVDYTYEGGILSWDKGCIRNEDVVAVINTLGGIAEHTIFSLEQEDPNSKDGDKGYPFKLQATNAVTLPQDFLDAFTFKGLPQHLQTGRARDLFILVSTLSGTGLAVAFFDEVLRPLLRALGFEDSRYTVIKTTTADSVRELAQFNLIDNANEGKEQTVIVLSGDGGIADTINALGEKQKSRYGWISLLARKDINESSKYVKPTFLQLPLGTGNALFHSLHKASPISSIYVQGLRTLLHGTPKPLPTFRASFSPGARLLTNEGQIATPLPNNVIFGAVVASHGLHSTLVADSDTVEYRKHGDKRFGMAAKDLMFPPDGGLPHKYQTEVTLIRNGQQHQLERNEHGYVLATLVSNLEKTFTISPESQPFECSLRVIYFGPLSGKDLAAVMEDAYQGGKHVERREVGYEKVEGIKILFKEQGQDWRWRRACIDGSIVGVEEGGWMDVRLVPEGEEAICVVADA
ncbi:glycogen synthase kinase mutation revertant [Diplocarpon rosae]|nr:glycogen synthase kinase mutation revertant [Diplocarpon rosae]